MRVTSDSKIQVSRGETLKLQSSSANLSLLGKEVDAGQELHIQLSSVVGTHQLEATSIGRGNLTISSSSGEQWTTALFPGSNVFEFVVEPEPDVWYCENDDGAPPHPVSKGEPIVWIPGSATIRFFIGTGYKLGASQISGSSPHL